MIKYPPSSYRAIGFLKSPRNDIEIYVEDFSKARQWLALIKNCLPHDVLITSVTSLGPRSDVIEACRSDQQDKDRKRLYIIDGDFDYIVGKDKPNLLHLYRIPAYCLEGMFFNENTVKHISSVMLPELDEEVIWEQYHDYIENIWGVCLRKLYTFFALNFLLSGSCVTSGRSVFSYRVNDNKPISPDLAEMTTHAIEIKNEVKGRNYDRQQHLLCKQNVERLPIRKVLSGKSAILPLTKSFFEGLEVTLQGDHIMLMAANANGLLDVRLKNRLAAISQ